MHIDAKLLAQKLSLVNI